MARAVWTKAGRGFLTRLTLAFLLVLTVALAKSKVIRYVPVKFWTHVHVTGCKQVSDSLLHCQADISFAGYTLQKPENDDTQVEKSKFKIDQ